MSTALNNIGAHPGFQNKKESPDINIIAEIANKEKVLSRIFKKRELQVKMSLIRIQNV